MIVISGASGRLGGRVARLIGGRPRSIASGEPATVSDDVERLTGHRAVSLRDLLARGL